MKNFVKCFKLKVNWPLIFLISIGGMIVGVYQSMRLNSQLNSNNLRYLCRNDGSIFAPTIEDLDDRLEIESYLLKVQGRTPKSYVNGSLIETGRQVFIMKYSPDSTLVKIKIPGIHNDRSDPKFKEEWIYFTFLAKKPCQPTSDSLF